jgi:hypothetical protein
MSNEALTWAFRQGISCADGKFVLVALADYADDEGSCYPGQERLATMTGQSVRTVRRQLANLEGLSLITRKPRYNRSGHRTSDRYHLCLPDSSTTGQPDRRSHEQTPPAKAATPTGQTGQVSLRGNHEQEPAEQPHVGDAAEQWSGKPKTAGPDLRDLDALFETFWSHCRRKIGKKDSKMAFLAACRRGVHPERLIAGMKAYTQSTAARDDSKVKHPLSWLRGEHWNDAPESISASSAWGPLAAPAAANDARWIDPAAAHF